MNHHIDRRRLLTTGGAATALALTGSGLALPAAQAAGTYRSGWGNAVFEDDFTGSRIDTSRWNVADQTYRSYDWGWIQASNASVSNGTLKLRAHRRSKPVTTRDGKVREWSCADLTTVGKFSQEFGRWEFRAKMPTAPGRSVGLWTGVWLRPDDTRIGGEIDIAESYGSKSSQAKTKFDQTSRAEASVHFNQQRKGTVHSWTPSGTNIYSQWNTWTMEKTPSGIRMFFNDQQILDVPSGTAAYRAAFPAGSKMNLRISFQIGNSYWGRPTSSTVSGQALELDYVRAWKYRG